MNTLFFINWVRSAIFSILLWNGESAEDKVSKPVQEAGRTGAK